ncbi:ELL-associated factor 2-like isoform X2 [Halichondria panicea]|uniref:ELL-associated factor 2-like isoform X2 n=1 Tax=Halichondria panicea TaxID=6063 RepID=UPI00312B7B43
MATVSDDLKPLSVDPTKPGKLRVADDEVNVQLPVVQAEWTDDVAQFRGPKKPVTKECVLIIDTVSGEAVLERISNNIQLKAIRDGRK